MSAQLSSPCTPLVDDLAPSPNFGDRRGRTIDALILHYTGMQTGAGALARLCDPASSVSCHYLVWEDGRITQLVAERERAWHAGRAFWAGERDMNAASLGIEIVNPGHDGGAPPYPAAQIEAVTALGRDLCHRHAIPPHRVLAHSDVAPDRKLDPGEWFPWQTLAEAGVGAFVDAGRDADTPVDIATLQRGLRAFGYDCPESGVLDAPTMTIVTAFQRHFRQARVDGLADAGTMAVLEALMALRKR